MCKTFFRLNNFYKPFFRRKSKKIKMLKIFFSRAVAKRYPSRSAYAADPGTQSKLTRDSLILSKGLPLYIDLSESKYGTQFFSTTYRIFRISIC